MDSTLSSLVQVKILAQLNLAQIMKLAFYYVKCSEQDKVDSIRSPHWDSFSQELSESTGVHICPKDCETAVEILRTRCPSALSFIRRQESAGEAFKNSAEIASGQRLTLQQYQAWRPNVCPGTDEILLNCMPYLHLPELARIATVNKQWHLRFLSLTSSQSFTHDFTETHRRKYYMFILRAHLQRISEDILPLLSCSSVPALDSSSKDSFSTQENAMDHPALTLARSPSAQALIKDIRRTLPDEPFIQTGRSQHMIFNVLQAYALHDPGAGYCQGDSFFFL